MKAFYVDERSDSVGKGQDCLTVVGVAAHYKQNVASQEEVLLHIVKVGRVFLVCAHNFSPKDEPGFAPIRCC
jgi:hypothetical protein